MHKMTANIYDLSCIDKHVQSAKIQQKQYLEKLLDLYPTKQKFRVENDIPVLAFCGHGRSGKDLGAEWLGNSFHATYNGSLSSIVCPLIASAVGVTVEECFKTRHENREYWFRFCNRLRYDDPTLLARMLLSQADIVVGIRGAVELDACKRRNIIDLSMWILNDRVLPDATVEFEPQDCDVVVYNTSTKFAYYNRLNAIATLSGLKPKHI